MSASSKLLNCPCGSSDVQRWEREAGRGTIGQEARVWCKGCEAWEVRAPSLEKAVELWNTRRATTVNWKREIEVQRRIGFLRGALMGVQHSLPSEIRLKVDEVLDETDDDKFPLPPFEITPGDN